MVLSQSLNFPLNFGGLFEWSVGAWGDGSIIIVGWFCGCRFLRTCALSGTPSSIARSITNNTYCIMGCTLRSVLLSGGLLLLLLLSLSFTLCLTGGMNVRWEEGQEGAYSSSCACKNEKVRYTLHCLNICCHVKTLLGSIPIG